MTSTLTDALQRLPGPAGERFAARIGRLAIRSLYREVALDGKPGLVGPAGSGSHPDMDFTTFMRSLQALRGYFPAIAACGLQRPGFAPLQALGIAAEADMLAATAAVNTHRGAIFNLGLLCAALGVLQAKGATLNAEAACAVVRRHWGRDILAGLSETTAGAPLSHGSGKRARRPSSMARIQLARLTTASRQVRSPVRK